MSFEAPKGGSKELSKQQAPNKEENQEENQEEKEKKEDKGFEQLLSEWSDIEDIEFSDDDSYNELIMAVHDLYQPKQRLKSFWNYWKKIQTENGKKQSRESMAFEESMEHYLKQVDEKVSMLDWKERRNVDYAVLWYHSHYETNLKLYEMFVEFEGVMGKYKELGKWDDKKGEFEDPVWQCCHKWMNEMDKFGSIRNAAKTLDWKRRKELGALFTKPFFNAITLNYQSLNWWQCHVCSFYNRVDDGIDQCEWCCCKNEWKHINKRQYRRWDNRCTWKVQKEKVERMQLQNQRWRCINRGSGYRV